MKKTLKKYFIPHKENDHKPYFLREKAVSITAVVVMFLLFASLAGTFLVKNTKFLAAIQSAFLVDLANEDRREQGAGQLVINEKLALAAQLKANDMASKEYFAHTSPEGLTPWHWFSEASYNYVYAGENLAVNFNRSEDVEKAWMGSPLHRANILNNRYKEIGIATAEGVYKGKSTTFVVQMFGTPVGGVTQVANVASAQNIAPEVQVTSKSLSSEVEGESTSKEEEDVSKEKAVSMEENTSLLLEQNKVAQITTTSSTLIQQKKIPENVIVPEEIFTETQNPDYPLPDNSLQNTNTEEVVPYTNWFERFLVNPANAVNNVYVILFAMILFSLILKIFVAIQKQHPKNIAYGVLLLILILVFMYINQEMFVTPEVVAF